MTRIEKKKNNSVDNCNFILGTQVALKTLTCVCSTIPINFFDRAIGGPRPPWPLLRTPLVLCVHSVHITMCTFCNKMLGCSNFYSIDLSCQGISNKRYMVNCTGNVKCN